MNLSNYLANGLLDHWLRNTPWTAPGTVYFALLKCTKGRRSSSYSYSLNDTIAVKANDNIYHLYKCTNGGTSASSQGTLYPGAKDEVITDGGATFVEQSSNLKANTSMNEVSGGSYARASLACSLNNFSGTQGLGSTVASSGTSGTTYNNVVITFPVPTADWTTSPETVWCVALYDASTSGNLLGLQPLVSPKGIINGDPAQTIQAGSWSFQIDQ